MNAMSMSNHDTMAAGLPPFVAALARADFTELAQRFGAAGFAVSMPCAGALQILPAAHGTLPEASHARILLPSGISDDATPGKARILMPSGVIDDYNPDGKHPQPRAAGGAFAAHSPAHAAVPEQTQEQAHRAQQATPSVLLSVGVHGDETGPIEVLAHLLDQLSSQPHLLRVNLLLMVGNVDAIACGKRFIDADLNRMFKRERGDLAGTAEAARADQMMAATQAFFAGKGPNRWHLDLHTAIRPSLYPAFAIVPMLIEDQARTRLTTWLGDAGVQALIMNPKSAGTYSYFTSEQCHAAGSTVELGRVGILGQNDLSQFAAASAALYGLLRNDAASIPKGEPALVFLMAQEIMKLSDDFKMAFGKDTQNFTVLKKGELIAEDGATQYVVQHDEEYVVFPNPNVRVGQRAGLMVVRQ
jgi:succinylglutamate desuccinylase